MKCSKCGKERKIFYNGMCQTCYRSETEKYKYYKLKTIKGERTDRDKFILECFLSGVKKDSITKFFNMTRRNLDIIISKNCIKCDKEGNAK